MVNYPTYPPYQNYYPNYRYQEPMQMPQTSVPNQILAWVQSEDEALKYPLSAGQSIFLMNQNEPYLYMKCVDQLGKASFVKKRLLDESEKQETDLTEYVRKEEIDNIILDLVQKEVERRMSQISFKPTRKKTVVVDEDDE